jgi:hypothetical protein
LPEIGKGFIRPSGTKNPLSIKEKEEGYMFHYSSEKW